MIQKIFLLLLLLASSTEGIFFRKKDQVQKTEVNLGKDYRHEGPFQGDLVLDIYHNPNKKIWWLLRMMQPTPPPPPLVLVAVGSGIGKEEYSMFAETMVRQKGYVVAIVSHPVYRGPALFNFVSALDISLAVEYMKTQKEADDPVKVDTDKTIMLGHSYGGTSVLFSIIEECRPPFCIEGVNIPLPPEIKGAAGYGTSVFKVARGSDNPDPEPVQGLANVKRSTNETLPFFLFTGEGDSSTFEVYPKSNITYTYEGFLRMKPYKVYALGSGLDHYSINNQVVGMELNARGDKISEQPREAQVQSVVNAFSTWIEFVLSGNTATHKSFCQFLDGHHSLGLEFCGEEFEYP